MLAENSRAKDKDSLFLTVIVANLCLTLFSPRKGEEVWVISLDSVEYAAGQEPRV
jgi:hypothetical protein